MLLNPFSAERPVGLKFDEKWAFLAVDERHRHEGVSAGGQGLEFQNSATGSEIAGKTLFEGDVAMGRDLRDLEANTVLFGAAKVHNQRVFIASILNFHMKDGIVSASKQLYFQFCFFSFKSFFGSNVVCYFLHLLCVFQRKTAGNARVRLFLFCDQIFRFVILKSDLQKWVPFFKDS